MMKTTMFLLFIQIIYPGIYFIVMISLSLLSPLVHPPLPSPPLPQARLYNTIFPFTCKTTRRILNINLNYDYTLRYQNQSTSRRNSEGTLHERTPLLFPSLQKVDTCASVLTVADSYPLQHGYQKKSSFLQSIFNSINILIGVGILALPLGFKV